MGERQSSVPATLAAQSADGPVDTNQLVTEFVPLYGEDRRSVGIGVLTYLDPNANPQHLDPHQGGIRSDRGYLNEVRTASAQLLYFVGDEARYIPTETTWRIIVLDVCLFALGWRGFARKLGSARGRTWRCFWRAFHAGSRRPYRSAVSVGLRAVGAIRNS